MNLLTLHKNQEENPKENQKPTYKVSPYMHKIEEKSCIYKNQGWKPIHQKYKVKESTSRHKPKKERKQTMNKNKVKALIKWDPWQ